MQSKMEEIYLKFIDVMELLRERGWKPDCWPGDAEVRAAVEEVNKRWEENPDRKWP